MTQENAAIDELTVLDRMKRAEELDPVALAAAPGEMERCVDACPSASHAEYYAAILRREHMAAQIKKAFTSLAAQLDTTDPEMVASETAEQMRAVLDDNEVAQELSVEKVLDDQVKKWRQAAVDRVAGKKVEIGVPMPCVLRGIRRHRASGRGRNPRCVCSDVVSLSQPRHQSE